MSERRIKTVADMTSRDIVDLLIRYAEQEERIAALEALLDEILNAEILWAHGQMKLRHTAVVKTILAKNAAKLFEREQKDE